MIRLTIDASPFGEAVSAEGRRGDRILDLCDESRAPVPFSCRSATCGTCLVRVRCGGELLDAPDADERAVLAALDAAPACRLACRAVVVGDTGTVHLAVETIGRDEEM